MVVDVVYTVFRSGICGTTAVYKQRWLIAMDKRDVTVMEVTCVHVLTVIGPVPTARANRIHWR